MRELKSSAEKLAYAAAYYEKNKEKIKARRRERWALANEEQRERQRESSRRYYHEVGAEASKARTIKWMRENRELVNARMRLSRYIKKGDTAAVERETALIAKLRADKAKQANVKVRT